MSKEIVKDFRYPNGTELTGYIVKSVIPSDMEIRDEIQGFAQYKTANNTLVQGEFEKNQLNGTGFTSHPDGQEYIGFFKNNLRHGTGCLYLGDRLITGQFEEGRIAGFCEIEQLADSIDPANFGVKICEETLTKIKVKKSIDPDEKMKVIKRGQFSDMKLNGFGEIINEKYGTSIKGMFKDDFIDGYGILTVNGQNYFGYFKEGHKSGEGSELDRSSCGYVGDHVENEREGWGIETQNEGQYTGQFSKSQKTGLAEIFDDDGNYIGSVKDGKPHGFGSYNGSAYQYIGEYCDGEFHGSGLYQCDKFQYLGTYKMGIFDGVGLKFGGSEYYKGEFKDGKKHGIALYKDLAGNAHLGEFINDSSKAGATVSKDELEAKVGHVDVNQFQIQSHEKIGALTGIIMQQKERLEKIPDSAGADFKKKSSLHSDQCKNLTDDYNFLLDQYNKKLDGFSSRCYKDKIQINVWNRKSDIKENVPTIPYKTQEDFDEESRKVMENFYQENKDRILAEMEASSKKDKTPEFLPENEEQIQEETQPLQEIVIIQDVEKALADTHPLKSIPDVEKGFDQSLSGVRDLKEDDSKAQIRKNSEDFSIEESTGKQTNEDQLMEKGPQTDPQLTQNQMAPAPEQAQETSLPRNPQDLVAENDEAEVQIVQSPQNATFIDRGLTEETQNPGELIPQILHSQQEQMEAQEGSRLSERVNSQEMVSSDSVKTERVVPEEEELQNLPEPPRIPEAVVLEVVERLENHSTKTQSKKRELPSNGSSQNDQSQGRVAGVNEGSPSENIASDNQSQDEPTVDDGLSQKTRDKRPESVKTMSKKAENMESHLNLDSPSHLDHNSDIRENQIKPTSEESVMLSEGFKDQPQDQSVQEDDKLAPSMPLQSPTDPQGLSSRKKSSKKVQRKIDFDQNQVSGIPLKIQKQHQSEKLINPKSSTDQDLQSDDLSSESFQEEKPKTIDESMEQQEPQLNSGNNQVVIQLPVQETILVHSQEQLNTPENTDQINQGGEQNLDVDTEKNSVNTFRKFKDGVDELDSKKSKRSKGSKKRRTHSEDSEALLSDNPNQLSELSIISDERSNEDKEKTAKKKRNQAQALAVQQSEPDGIRNSAGGNIKFSTHDENEDEFVDRDDSLEILRIENEIKLRELELKKAELMRLKKAKNKNRDSQRPKPTEHESEIDPIETQLVKPNTKKHRQYSYQNEDYIHDKYTEVQIPEEQDQNIGYTSRADKIASSRENHHQDQEKKHNPHQGQGSLTTRDVEDFLEKKRQDQKKTKADRVAKSPRRKEKSGISEQYPGISKTVIVQYRTTILDEFGNEIDNIVEEEEIRNDELNSKFVTKKAVKKNSNGQNAMPKIKKRKTKKKGTLAVTSKSPKQMRNSSRILNRPDFVVPKKTNIETRDQSPAQTIPKRVNRAQESYGNSGDRKSSTSRSITKLERLEQQKKSSIMQQTKHNNNSPTRKLNQEGTLRSQPSVRYHQLLDEMYGGMGIYRTREGSVWKTRSKERITNTGLLSNKSDPRKHLGYNKPDWDRDTNTLVIGSPKPHAHRQKFRSEYGKIDEFEDLQRLAEIEEELNQIREEPQFRNMSISEYKDILDREKNLIKNLNLWDLDYLDTEQFMRMKKLTSHFNYILRFGQNIRKTSNLRTQATNRRTLSRSRSRSRSNSRDSLRSNEFLDDLKDRYIQLKHTYYEAIRAGYHIVGNPQKYRFDRNSSGAFQNQLRNQEYRLPYEMSNRAGDSGSKG